MKSLVPHRLFSVRRIIFAALTLVTIIPLVVFWFWPFSRAIDEDLEHTARAHLLMARNLGVALDRYYTDVMAVFELLRENIVAGRTPLALEPLLSNMHFRHVCLAEQDTGTVLAGYINNDLTCPETVPPERLAMLRDLAAGGTVAFSGVTAGPDGQPVVYIAEQSQGLLTVGALDTAFFEQLARQIAFGVNGHAAIVDSAGNLLAHPNPTWVAERRNLSALPIVDNIISGETGVMTFYSPAFEADMIAGYTRAPLSGWGVMVPQPVAELEAEIGGIRQSGLGVLALGIAVALAVAWVLSGLLAKPIRQVLALTQSIDSAQPAVRLPPLSWYAPREMRALATSINDMLARIGEAADKVVQAQRRAEHDNTMKTEFLANMSHELRTPLNAIVGFSEILDRDTFGVLPEEKRREYIAHINTSAKHLTALINDLTDVSFIETGSSEHHETTFSLADSIERAVGLLRVQASAKGIRLEAADAPQPVTLRGDARHFTQVLINLLTNATKFTKPPHGRVTVSTVLEPAGTIRISVADNGVGIPKGQIAAVMQPFKRGEDPYVRDQPGSGLGLSIVTKILKTHGARLEIESKVGEGTTATIVWPQERVVRTNGAANGTSDATAEDRPCAAAERPDVARGSIAPVGTSRRRRRGGRQRPPSSPG